MTDERFQRLTDGQRDCLRLILRHRQIKEIAYELKISKSTVNQRLERARGILGASSSLAAALIVAEHESWPDIWIPDARYGNALSPELATTSSEAATTGTATDDAFLRDHTDSSPSDTARDMSREAVIRWPFPSAGRPHNDLTALSRMVWVLPVAILSVALLMIVAMLSLGLQDMLAGLHELLARLF